MDEPPGGMDSAERLSLWLNAFDAINLQAAHQAMRASHDGARAATARARPREAGSLAADVERVRAALAASIAQDPQALAAPELPRRGAGAGRGPAAVAHGQPTYTPYQQRHHELQRQMELMIAPLREHVRQALGRQSARLRRLAALDAALEQALLRREQQLLPTVPALLKRRFEQLRGRQGGADAADPAPAAAGAPEWLATFAREWRQTLLAEVDLRLQPVAGLVEAAAHEFTDRR